MSASVDSKPLTLMLSLLDATLTKNVGGGPVMVNQAPDEGLSVLNDHRE